ncbi:GNAT family N-acetyltransferase [Paenibacillus sp. L3-i20]|uniref:GNAT family N-acetyltransferase n=1 Tax=Paenibacillus sp. L3-i20 TaxID=2905833 RepID=UPI001EDD8845|nr:GNAT family N-acetyltransferase [Paenibacillus sp. L3-i20]GKU79150.1 N-acetyltransferase [Paenibacillus sp. L3-i20]
MEIRIPNLLELKVLLALSPQAMFEGTMGRVKPTEEKMKQLVEPLLEKGCNYLIATEDSKLLGWVLIGASTDQFTDNVIGFIYELYVIEEFRGKGISRKLMNHAIEQLKIEGYLEVRLAVFVENQAIQLYEKLGFSKRNITMSLPL